MDPKKRFDVKVGLKENITTTPKAQTLEEILKSPNVKKEDLKKETPKRRLDIQK